MARLRDILFPASLVAAQLCLFGPQTIYVGNVAEFSAPFWALVPPLLAAGGTIVLALVAVRLRLTTQSSRYFIALLFGVGLAVWIQGNLLVADYGVLDGSDIDWTIESWRNPYEMEAARLPRTRSDGPRARVEGVNSSSPSRNLQRAPPRH